jgi:hypothetical protein
MDFERLQLVGFFRRSLRQAQPGEFACPHSAMFKRAVVKAAQNPLGGKETKKLRIDIQKRLDITDDELDLFFAESCPAPPPPVMRARIRAGWFPFPSQCRAFARTRQHSTSTTSFPLAKIREVVTPCACVGEGQHPDLQARGACRKRCGILQWRRAMLC